MSVQVALLDGCYEVLCLPSCPGAPGPQSQVKHTLSQGALDCWPHLQYEMPPGNVDIMDVKAAEGGDIY